jgi:hypothetical protein
MKSAVVVTAVALSVIREAQARRIDSGERGSRGGMFAGAQRTEDADERQKQRERDGCAGGTPGSGVTKPPHGGKVPPRRRASR